MNIQDWNIYIKVRVQREVVKVYLDSESSVVVGAVVVVEPRHRGDVQVDHVLLHLLGQIVTVAGPVPGQTQLRLRALTSVMITRWSRGNLGLTLFMMMEYGSPIPPQVQTMTVVSAMLQSVLLILYPSFPPPPT